MVLLESHAGLWSQLQAAASQQALGAAQLVQQLILFLNGFLLLNEANKAAVFAVDDAGRCATNHLF